MSTVKAANHQQDQEEPLDLAQTCCLCDDGGQLVECYRCGMSCCYGLELAVPVGQTSRLEVELGLEDHDNSSPCITLPTSFDVSVREFWCPLCLEHSPDRAVDYIINRGSRATQRRVVSSEVVLAISYLPGLERECRQFVRLLTSVLGAFHVVAHDYWQPLPVYLSQADIRKLSQSKIPFHFVFILYTESSIGGGWLFEANAQETEGMILTNFLSAYDVIARRALSARIFCVACGLNLAGPGVIADIEHAFQMRPCWQSIVLPAAASVLPSEYIGILPQIFTHLYYLGTPLASALARVWAARKPAAYHTDLVVFEKPNEGGEPSIIKYTYGSASSRPWGLVLPEPGSLCICATSTDAVKWIRQGNSEETKFRERLVRYRSSCGHVYLRIAICLDGVKTTKAAGVQIVKQPFDRKKSAFPLDSRDWFHFDVYKVVDPKRMSKFRDHKEPWTLRGRMLQPKVTEGVNGAQPKSTHASPREG